MTGYVGCLKRELIGVEMEQKALRRPPRLAIAVLGGMLAAGIGMHHNDHRESQQDFHGRPGLVEAAPPIAAPSANGLMSVEPDLCTPNTLEALADQLKRSSVLLSSNEALGSGIIIYSDGKETKILTNRHVVEADGSSGKPKLAPGMMAYNDGKPGRVKKVQIAPKGLDLAIVTVEGDLGPAVKTNTERLARGNRLMIIGAPLGYEDSVSTGIVSNFSRRETEGGFGYTAIQTDAAINPGNSGGGFFLASGELIGITAFKLRVSDSETAEGMGFAIPIRYIYDFPYQGWQSLS